MDYYFLKKDGTIKKNYIAACQFLTTAKIEHHQISVGGNYTLLNDMRDGKIIDKYDAYTITCDLEYANERHRLLDKVMMICECFDITPKYTYSLKDWSVVFKDCNVEYNIMKRQLLEYLRR